MKLLAVFVKMIQWAGFSVTKNSLLCLTDKTDDREEHDDHDDQDEEKMKNSDEVK